MDSNAQGAPTVPPPANHVGHHMPAWLVWLQDNVLLPLLMACSGYIFGITLAQGIVPNIEDPSTWGAFGTVGVILFFSAGFAGGGLALRTSFKAAISLMRGQIGFGLGNLLGSMIICVIEIWCSLAERSYNLKPSPADNTVLGIFGVVPIGISITVLVVAFFVPLISFFWGFSQEKAQVEDPAELKRQHEVERLKAEQKAALALQKAQTRTQVAGAYLKGGLQTLANAVGSTGEAPSAPEQMSMPAQVSVAQIAPPAPAVALASLEVPAEDEAEPVVVHTSTAPAKPRDRKAPRLMPQAKPGTAAFNERVKNVADLLYQKHGKVTIHDIATYIGETADAVEAAVNAIKDHRVSRLRAGTDITRDPVLEAL